MTDEFEKRAWEWLEPYIGKLDTWDEYEHGKHRTLAALLRERTFGVYWSEW